MQKSIQLRMPRLPEALGNLAHSNQFLKVAVFFSYGIVLLLLCLVTYLMTRPPLILALAPDASSYQRVSMPSAEQEVMAAVRAYMELRYKWEPKSVVKRLEAARAFILPETRKAFEGGIAGVIKFSLEKDVSQRAYADKILVDLEKRTASISGDRVTVIQGMKAAGDLRMQLTYISGPRTAQNPWGVYIAKEKEE